VRDPQVWRPSFWSPVDPVSGPVAKEARIGFESERSRRMTWPVGRARNGEVYIGSALNATTAALGLITSGARPMSSRMKSTVDRCARCEMSARWAVAHTGGAQCGGDPVGSGD
jgi:hypothetical protein